MVTTLEECELSQVFQKRFCPLGSDFWVRILIILLLSWLVRDFFNVLISKTWVYEILFMNFIHEIIGFSILYPHTDFLARISVLLSLLLPFEISKICFFLCFRNFFENKKLPFLPVVDHKPHSSRRTLHTADTSLCSSSYHFPNLFLTSTWFFQGKIRPHIFFTEIDTIP